jgi:LPXTG-motif cell wall-anchored protein
VVTPTALPKTGAGDEFQLPLLVGAAILLVVVIFIARRLRMAH